ncbi:MAG: hypothetical protein LBF58_02005, partial [Deltaproteobacteria bacterium]|nr:hypothetical protein [Deltaproteobacteria bacterium]
MSGDDINLYIVFFISFLILISVAIYFIISKDDNTVNPNKNKNIPVLEKDKNSTHLFLKTPLKAEPEGFREVLLGMSFETFKIKYKYEFINAYQDISLIKMLKRTDENLNIGNIAIKEVIYFFLYDILFKKLINYSYTQETTHNFLLAVFTEKYGEPTEMYDTEVGKTIHWLWEKKAISMLNSLIIIQDNTHELRFQ